jgi:hypothetical protein
MEEKMFITKATAAILLAVGLGAGSISSTGDSGLAVQTETPQWQTEVVEAVGWDGGPGALIQL